MLKKFPDQLELLHQWVKRRVKKEPLQYITGHCEFYGRTFIVNKDVFIPRPETERLVDVAIAILKAANKPTVLDMGTGTGCIAVSLAKEIPNSKITGIDISTVAIEVTPPFLAASETVATLNIFPSETPTLSPSALLVAATGDVTAQEHNIALINNIDNIFFILFYN